MPDRSALLSMHGISKSFGATRALADVSSCRCAPGEVLALIGENGAGKSTLMKVLSAPIARTPARCFSTAGPMPPAARTRRAGRAWP